MFGRTDTSTLARWWWTVDRWSLLAIGLIIGFGWLMITTAGPVAADRIHASHDHFVNRQLVFLIPAMVTVIGISMLTPRYVLYLALLMLGGAVLLMMALPFAGTGIKGAIRWINIAGISIQPSEFAKPSFAVVVAWLFARAQLNPRGFGTWAAIGLYLLVAGLLVIQPDIGMTLVITAIWGAEFFLAGISWFLIIGFVILVVCGGIGAYFVFPHITKRIDAFMDPGAGEKTISYQVNQALSGFHSGGLRGVGFGEGRFKASLPDAHTDFIMAVAGEEFGLLVCLFIVFLFAFVVLRGLIRMRREDDLFIVLATSGLLVQFGLQAWVNMASTLRLMPAKGMTLPFISYGGSSTVAIALGMGMMLALTCKRFGAEGWK